MKKDDWTITLLLLTPLAVVWIGFAVQVFGPGALFIVSASVGGAWLVWNNYQQDLKNQEVRRLIDELNRKIEASK